MENLFDKMNAMRMIARMLAIGVVLFGGLLATQTQAAGPIVSITLTPGSVTMTADETQAFTVTATDQDGITSNVTSGSTISMNDPLGSMTGSTYHAGQVGTWTVLATYQSFSDTASVTVTAGALQELVINPHSDPEFVNQGTTKQFSVRGYDAHSNEVKGFTPTWSVIGDLGSIDANGLFTASRIGTGQLHVTVGTITGQIPVVVKEAPVETVDTNTNANTNTASNTNASVNGNTNSSINANVDEDTNTNSTPATSDDESEEPLQCTTMSTWLWVLILVVFLIGVAILYAMVPMSRIWPAVVGLGGAIILIIVHRNYGCDLLGWWDWVLALGTLGLSILALRQLPLPKPPQA